MRDYRDIIGGVLLVSGGAWIVWHTLNTLDIGTLRRMGPGMFPLMIGTILTILGSAIAISGLFRYGAIEQIEWRAMLAVAAGIVAFAVTIGPFGLLPAIISLILVSSLADSVFRPIAIAAMCVIFPLAAYLVFHVGLGLPLVMWRGLF